MKYILAFLSLLIPVSSYAADARMIATNSPTTATYAGAKKELPMSVPVCSVDEDGVPQVCSGMSGGGAGSALQVSPVFSGGANLSISTAASYTPFPTQTCKQLTLANNTGVTVQVQQGGSGAAQPVFPGTYYVFYGLTDASSLAVERADGTATAVTVNARCEY